METEVKVEELKKSEILMKLSWEKFCEFEEYVYEEKDGQSVADYIRGWEARLEAATAAGCDYSDTLLAHRLLAGARLHQAYNHSFNSFFFYLFDFPILAGEVPVRYFPKNVCR
jgi:hypothetical protein